MTSIHSKKIRSSFIEEKRLCRVVVLANVTRCCWSLARIRHPSRISRETNPIPLARPAAEISGSRAKRSSSPVVSFSGEATNRTERSIVRDKHVGRCPPFPHWASRSNYSREVWQKESRVSTFLIKFPNVGRRCATASRPRGGLENFQEFNWSPGILAYAPLPTRKSVLPGKFARNPPHNTSPMCQQYVRFRGKPRRVSCHPIVILSMKRVTWKSFESEKASVPSFDRNRCSI